MGCSAEGKWQARSPCRSETGICKGTYANYRANAGQGILHYTEVVSVPASTMNVFFEDEVVSAYDEIYVKYPEDILYIDRDCPQ